MKTQQNLLPFSASIYMMIPKIIILTAKNLLIYLYLHSTCYSSSIISLKKFLTKHVVAPLTLYLRVYLSLGISTGDHFLMSLN